MTIKAPIVEMLERKIAAEVREDLKKEKKESVVLLSFISISVISLILSIFKPIIIVICIFSMLCTIVYSFYKENLVRTNPDDKQVDSDSKIIEEICSSEDKNENFHTSPK